MAIPEAEQNEIASQVPAGDIALTVEEAAKVLKIGRTLMYSLVTSGEVESVTIGRLRRIPAECVSEYLQRLRAGQRPGNAA